MPEIFDGYIDDILNNNSKFLKENLTDFIIKTTLTKISSEEEEKIKSSLIILGLEDFQFGIEKFFEKGYLQKIVGIEERLLKLKEVGFYISYHSISSLCDSNQKDISKSLEKYERLFQKLSELKELGFCFDGNSFCNILHIPESQIDKIIAYKTKLLFLYPFGVRMNLTDWEYFNFDENLLNRLFSLGEKLKLSGKIGLQISLKQICAIKNKVDLRKELENTQEAILGKIQAILGMKNKNLDDEFQYIQKIITTDKILNNNFIIQEEKPIKEYIFSFNEDSNNFNPAFLDTIDEAIFDKAGENIDVLSCLLQKICLSNINIKDFLELSYLFDKPEVIKNITTLIDSGLSIGLNDLKNRGDLFKKIDEEIVGYIIQMKVIHSGNVFDDITLIQHIVTKKDNVKTILNNEVKYKKLVGLYQMLFGDEEILFKNGVYVGSIVELLNSPNFDKLEGIFQELKLYVGNKPIHDKIFHPENLSFIMNITSQTPGSITKFINTYFEYNFPVGIIDALLKEELIDNLEDFLKNFSENGLQGTSKYFNEFILLCNAFGFEISEKTRKQTYDYNIKTILSGNQKPQNITSLEEIFEHLEKTGFLQGKITKDNIEEIGALMNFDFTSYEGETIDALLQLKSENDIDTYKKVVRALGEYMYDNYLNGPNNYQELVFIFGKVFNSSFLRKLFNQTNRKDLFDYLLSKKVRLQDIERAFNNYDKLFSLDIKNPYYKFCLDYSLENDNYDYLAQNIEAMKYLQERDFMNKVIASGVQNAITTEELYNGFLNFFSQENITKKKNILDNTGMIEMLKEILTFTGGYLTVSMIEGYIRGKSLEELLEESLEAKKEVLSPKPITHHNLATYETIFLAYRPTGFTIDTIQKNIENGNIADMSHHLEGIQYNPDGYPMEFFQRSYSLEGKQDEIVVNSVNNLLQGKNIDGNIFQGFNLKLFFSQATSLFSTSDGVTTSNDGILKLISSIYTLNKDSRIQSYVSNFTGSDFSYERLLELREIFAVVTKDSFDQIIGNEISRLSNEEQEKIWENIGKLKDKNVKSKYTEINAKDIGIHEKIKEIFIWRLLGYASQIRKYISTEMKKFKETKGKQTPVKAQLSKNIGSFFAKAGAGLCTSENYEMWKEKRHIHLNLIDEQRQEIIGNVMLYFEPGRNYLITRGFNPRTDIESSYDVNHMVDEMIRVVKEIAVQNGYVDENGEALVYIPPHEEFHALSNREKVRKRILYLAEKINFPIHDANFYANILGVKDNGYTNYLYKTLHRI